MAINDPAVGEEPGQCLLDELRMTPRSGNLPDIRNLANSVRLEKRDELGRGARRMADRVDHA
jgi:hypothetical protein